MKNEISKIHDEILVQLASDPRNSTQQPAAMIQTICEVVGKTLDAEQVSTWKWDEEKSCIVLQNLFDRTYDLHETALQYEIKNGAGIVKLLQRQRFLNIFNTQQEEYHQLLFESDWGMNDAKSVLLIPLRGKGKITGLLRVDQIRSRRIWIDEEINFACQVADLIAMTNMHFELKHYDSKWEHLVTLAHAMETDLNFHSLGQKFAASMTGFLQADQGLIFAVDAVDQSLSVIFHFKAPGGYEKLRLEAGEGAAGWAARNKEIINVDSYQDLQTREAIFDKNQPFDHVIVAPLLRKEHCQYVLQVMRVGSCGYFTPSDVRSMEQMVAWFGLLVDQNNFGDRVDLIRNFQKTLNRILESGEYANSVPEIMNGILDFCLPIFKGKQVLLQCDDWRLSRHLSETFREELSALLSKNEFVQKEALVINTIEQIENSYPELTLQLKKENIQSFMLTGLTRDQQGIGFLLIGRDTEADWGEDEERMLEITSRLMTLEVRRAATFQENTRRELLNWRMNALGHRLSHALTYEEAVQVVGSVAVELLAPDKVILLLRRPQNKIEGAFLYNIQDWTMQIILEHESAHIERLFMSKSAPALISNVQQSHLSEGLLSYFTDLGCSTIKVLPMNYQDQPVGVILALYEQEQSWPQYEIDSLRIFTQIAVLSIQNAWMYEELEKGYLDVALALANEISVRETAISGIGLEIANWAEKTARMLACSEDEIRDIRWAALLHDIGKSEVPNDVLLKPGPLSEEEWALVQKTPEEGEKYIRPLSRFRSVGSIIRSSRERFDGSGYPDQLRGGEIPLGARVLAVAESYASMIDTRPYRQAMPAEQAIAELFANRGTQFDPHVVEAFVSALGLVNSE